MTKPEKNSTREKILHIDTKTVFIAAATFLHLHKLKTSNTYRFVTQHSTPT